MTETEKTRKDITKEEFNNILNIINGYLTNNNLEQRKLYPKDLEKRYPKFKENIIFDNDNSIIENFKFNFDFDFDFKEKVKLKNNYFKKTIHPNWYLSFQETNIIKGLVISNENIRQLSHTDRNTLIVKDNIIEINQDGKIEMKETLNIKLSDGKIPNIKIENSKIENFHLNGKIAIESIIIDKDTKIEKIYIDFQNAEIGNLEIGTPNIFGEDYNLARNFFTRLKNYLNKNGDKIGANLAYKMELEKYRKQLRWRDDLADWLLLNINDFISENRTNIILPILWYINLIILMVNIYYFYFNENIEILFLLLPAGFIPFISSVKDIADTYSWWGILLIIFEQIVVAILYYEAISIAQKFKNK